MFRWVMRVLSPRQFRLYVAACCASLWDDLTPPSARQAIDVLERYADGLAGAKDLAEARESARVEAERLDSLQFDTAGGWCDTLRNQSLALFAAAATALRPRVQPELWAWQPGAHRPSDCDLLRCIGGNSFRPVTVDPVWLSWNDGCVLRLAELIYAEWRYEDLPVLADALEDAGCAEAALLAHLRGPGPHCRGCWPMDRLLEKK
jgi:hypothetical protein